MGLDMYLVKRKKGDKREYWDFDNEMIYWRKVNAVHRYLCDNGIEIEEEIIYKETKETLENLLSICKEVIEKAIVDYKGERIDINKIENENTFEWHEAKVINEDEIAALLPTCSGFFYGSLAYDGWYLYDIKKTIEQLEEVIPTIDFDNEEVYYLASW